MVMVTHLVMMSPTARCSMASYYPALYGQLVPVDAVTRLTVRLSTAATRALGSLSSEEGSGGSAAASAASSSGQPSAQHTVTRAASDTCTER